MDLGIKPDDDLMSPLNQVPLFDFFGLPPFEQDAHMGLWTPETVANEDVSRPSVTSLGLNHMIEDE